MPAGPGRLPHAHREQQGVKSFFCKTVEKKDRPGPGPLIQKCVESARLGDYMTRLARAAVRAGSVVRPYATHTHTHTGGRVLRAVL